jgi:voltage-gated potassium channel
LKEHIVVVGVGATGIHIVEELHTIKTPFVVIDVDEHRLHMVATDMIPGMLYVRGDATNDYVLEQAGIARAKGLAAALSDDKDNVFVSITARALNPNLRIVAKMTEDSAEMKLKRAGANVAVSPSQIGGMRMVSELVRPRNSGAASPMVRSAVCDGSSPPRRARSRGVVGTSTVYASRRCATLDGPVSLVTLPGRH